MYTELSCSCLKRVKPECPLCRTPFEWSGILRLHIDIEPPINASSPASSAGAPDSPSSVSSNTSPDVRARQLQEAIVTVANVGASEDRYRQLIAECRAFLKPLPKNSVSIRLFACRYSGGTVIRWSQSPLVSWRGTRSGFSKADVHPSTRSSA